MELQLVELKEVKNVKNMDTGAIRDCLHGSYPKSTGFHVHLCIAFLDSPWAMYNTSHIIIQLTSNFITERLLKWMPITHANLPDQENAQLRDPSEPCLYLDRSHSLLCTMTPTFAEADPPCFQSCHTYLTNPTLAKYHDPPCW